MSEQLLVRFEERGLISIGHIEASSVLDALNVNKFGELVLDHVRKHPGVYFLLDFQRVQYLSSAVLTELLRTSQACKEGGGELRLCGLNKDILKVFQITNLDKMFTIYGQVDDAVIKFARSLSIQVKEEAWSDPDKRT
jgi:anti-anti-sigma factor